jgi:predicted NBD/HSP70 family sugar kinase
VSGARTRALIVLHERGTISRSDLGSALGITRSTAAAISAELCRAGYAEESGGLSGHVGRPSHTLRADPTSIVIVSVDVRVDSCHALAYGLGGTHLAREVIDREMAGMTPEEAGATVARSVEGVQSVLPADSRIAGISISVPGIVDSITGFVSYAPHLGWRDVEWGPSLLTALDTPLPVSFGNDANLGALGEHLRGAGRGVEAMLYVSGGIGIGGGYVERGRVRMGGAGFAGEIGHMPIGPDGEPCLCGARGCWETLIGRDVIASRWNGDFNYLLHAAHRGEGGALDVMKATGHWLGLGLRGLIAITDPARVVLGGHLAALLPLVSEYVQAECASLPQVRTGRVDIVAGALGQDAALIGGAEVQMMATIGSASPI